MDLTMRSLAAVCVVIALIPLGSIIYTAADRGGSVIFPRTGPMGLPSINAGFFLENPPQPCSVTNATPVCPTGGIGNAIQGTFIMLGLAALMAMPLGILAGIYLNEFGRHRFGRAASFLVDVMSGVPSIIIGVFVFTVFYELNPQNHEAAFSAFSGSVALMLIMLPVVIRTTEESLRLVPRTVREAAFALGIPQQRTTLRIVLPTGAGAVVTGALLAVARAGGEAAPLLFTAFGSPRGFQGFGQPTQAIAPLIYTLGSQPYSNWVADAWGAALFLILVMLSISLTARLILYRRAAALQGAG
jgi:phosphate transport system permease protein